MTGKKGVTGKKQVSRESNAEGGTTSDRSRLKKKDRKKISPRKRIVQKVRGFLSRRPHRSFRRTRRRDYARSLKLPGYWVFSRNVLRVITKNRKQFLLIGLLYVIVNAIFLGLSSQDGFTTLRDTLQDMGQEVLGGDWSAVGEASLLALSTLTGSISPSLSDVQQVYAVILGLLMWLTLVWFLRQRLAGRSTKVRDALYNAGAPIVPTALLFIVLLLQLLPLALVAIGYVAAQASGLLAGGVEAMLFWLAAAGLATLSLYWVSGTALALVIVTLPGMYPLRALKIAGDMVVGRRLRILYRIAWMLIVTVIVWIAVLIPMIMIDAGIKGWLPVIDWLPIVPVVIAILGGVSFIWITTYIYMFYRGIVDDDAKPA